MTTESRFEAKAGPVVMRAPIQADGKSLWQVARDSGALDENSPYAYLMWAREFASTSIVAEQDRRIVGFVTGLRPPPRPDVLFVWQVAVAAEGRGQGLATRMLESLFERARRAAEGSGAPPLRFLEATVTPSNAASMALFRGFARRRDVPCHESVAIEAGDFPPGDHEAEHLLRIGPLPAQLNQ